MLTKGGILGFGRIPFVQSKFVVLEAAEVTVPGDVCSRASRICANLHTPRALTGDVRQLLKPYNPHGKVTHLAFGVQGSYVIVFEDGHIDWDLKSQYNGLDEELEARNQGDLVYVSLSAYASGVFFAAFKDATVRYELPEGMEHLDEDFLAADTLRVICPSDTAKHTGVPIQKKSSALRDFSVDVTKAVTENIVESAITGDN
jgi:hypothetical protein